MGSESDVKSSNSLYYGALGARKTGHLPDPGVAWTLDVWNPDVAPPSVTNDTVQRTILDEANAAVFGAREKDYGHPRDDFARIATLWTAYLQGRAPVNNQIMPEDVPCLMILLKMARLSNTPNHRDSWVDIAGYAETGARVVGLDA